MLLFKKKFLPAILCGEKTQTIRMWKHCRMRAGQRSYIPGAGYIRIESIDLVDDLDTLTEEDAKRDGFESVELLRAEIEQLYPSASEDKTSPYRICFTLISAPEQKEVTSGP